jgi:lipopolysaccharide export system permease protein
MSPWKTLFRYIVLQFFTWCAAVFLAMLLIVFLLDYIELIRRAGNRPEATLLVLLEMAALKQPHMAEQVLPFAILFGTMMAFWRMTRMNELVVARAAGVSVWQFLTPPLAGAVVIGVLTVTVFNPLASVLQARYEALEARILRGSGDQFSLSRAGLWLRQSENEGDNSVVHAERMVPKRSVLEDVMILSFNDMTLIGRIDAKRAVLHSGKKHSDWEVSDGVRWTPGRPPEPFKNMVVPTNLTPTKIQESFASPETMSFWELPGFIELLESSGFSAQRHRLYFNRLLALPFLFSAMVLIAATFSLRMQRRGGTTLMIAGGIISGFVLYLLSNVIFALGLAATIPVSLAAWTPTGVSWLLGASLLLHLEDG